MRGRELGDKRTQLGFCRSSRHRRLDAAGDLDFNLVGTASGGFFLHAHEGSLGGVLIWCTVGFRTFRGEDSIQSEISPGEPPDERSASGCRRVQAGAFGRIKRAPMIPQGMYKMRSSTTNQSGAGIDMAFTIPPSRKNPPTIAPRSFAERRAMAEATRPPTSAPPAWATRTIRIAGSVNVATYAFIASG